MARRALVFCCRLRHRSCKPTKDHSNTRATLKQHSSNTRASQRILLPDHGRAMVLSTGDLQQCSTSPAEAQDTQVWLSLAICELLRCSCPQHMRKTGQRTSALACGQCRRFASTKAPNHRMTLNDHVTTSGLRLVFGQASCRLPGSFVVRPSRSNASPLRMPVYCRWHRVHMLANIEPVLLQTSLLACLQASVLGKRPERLVEELHSRLRLLQVPPFRMFRRLDGTSRCFCPWH